MATATSEEGPVDEPLQLIEFIKTDESDGKTEIQLKYENLERILKPCENRPLSILTVCGPSRMGKSFLLGYMIRCLEALEKEETDWMEWDKTTKPLNGFKFRSGVKPETQGIWVWSRPFKIKSDEGQEVSVLLVDTQGTQDEFTSTKVMSAIVGLSLLTSSVMIFNFFTNLQEDILVALNTYIQYGLLALTHSKEEEAPFQKLIFLIRDWNQPGDFPFGEKGGKKFLEEKLQMKSDQSKEAKEVRETIRKCFQNLECFLMPHIGMKAIYSDFTGSISELDHTFARKLEEFISSLINVEDIVIKKVLGNPVNATELKSYLEAFIEVFNSEDIPTPTNILEATSKAYNQNEILKALKKYEENLKKKLRGRAYLKTSDLEKAHEAAQKIAKESLKEIKKVGDSDACEAELDVLIQEKYVPLKAQNEERRRNFITQTTNEAVSIFREDLETEFPFTPENETGFYEEKEVKKAVNRLRSQVTSDFKERMDEEEEDEVLKLLERLNESLEVVVQSIMEKNKARRLCAENEMSKIVKNLVADYKTKMNDFVAANKFEDDEKIKEFHDDIRKGTLESFENIQKPGGKDFHKPFQEELMNLVDEAFQSIWDKLKLQLKEIHEQANQYIMEQCGQYLADLRTVIADDCYDAKVLQEKHEKQREEFLMDLEISKYYPPETSFHKNLMDKAQTELEMAYESVMNEFKIILKESEESLQNAQSKSIRHYKDEMKRIASEAEGGFLDDQNLEEAHQSLKEESLKIFTAAPKSGPFTRNQEFLDKFLEELNIELEEILETLKKENLNILETAKLKATNLVHVCHSDYAALMKVEVDDTVRTQDDLTAAHDKIKSLTVQKFKDEVPIKSPDFIEAYLEQLEEEIEETFEEFVELFELKSTETATKMKGLLIECRQQYFQEMEKQCSSEFFIKPDYLEALHHTSKQIVLRKLSRKDGDKITTVQSEDLMKEMDGQFEAYKIKNDMKLNSDMGLGFAPAIGIDLGTTYCCVGVFHKGNVIIIPNLDQGGNLTTPSYVAYNGSDVVIGEAAKENAYKNPENTIYDAKRIIGRKMKDPVLQEDMKMWPFTVQEDEGVPKILAGGQLLYPEQVSAKLLSYFKTMAEKFLQLEPGTITKAVITVPAYFNDGQRQATVDAGKLAGLEVLTILNEPTAAAIAYSLERLERTARKVLVYDLGGGTFDVAVLDISSNKIEVLGVDGDTHLGGEDFDKNMMTFCCQKFKESTGIDLFADKDSLSPAKRVVANRKLGRVRLYCEKAKKQLATARSVKVSIDAIESGLDMAVEMTREKFDDLNDKEFKRTIEIVERALKTVKVGKEEIDDVVLVGGSSRILKVQELLKEYFGGKALNHSIHPDHCVAYGAAVKAAMMNGEQSKGSIDFSKIQDVTPLSLGLKNHNGTFAIVIPKNTKIPCKLTKHRYTVGDNQTSVHVRILQGEQPVALENELLGEFYFDGIPKARAGEIPLTASMEIDSMGILHVEYFCEASGSKNSLTLTEHRQRMSKETIDRLLAENKINP